MQRNADQRLLVIKRCHNATAAAVREAELLLTLRHPSIVRVHEHFMERPSDLLCIVMDYAAGGDLEQHIAKRRTAKFPLTDREAFHVISQLVDALAHCHKHHVLHRE